MTEMTKAQKTLGLVGMSALNRKVCPPPLPRDSGTHPPRLVLGCPPPPPWARCFGSLKNPFSGPKMTNGEFGGSKTPNPPEMPIKIGKTSQHHNWPRYMDWPQIRRNIAVKQGTKRQKHKWHRFLGAEKTMTATDVTGFDAIFSTGFFATFSRFWGARLTKLHREPGEKAKNTSGEPPVETAPRNCRFLSLVVVERVLNFARRQPPPPFSIKPTLPAISLGTSSLSPAPNRKIYEIYPKRPPIRTLCNRAGPI